VQPAVGQGAAAVRAAADLPAERGLSDPPAGGLWDFADREAAGRRVRAERARAAVAGAARARVA